VNPVPLDVQLVNTAPDYLQRANDQISTLCGQEHGQRDLGRPGHDHRQQFPSTHQLSAGLACAPNATITCTATYTINQADIDAGSARTFATAHAGGIDSNQDSQTRRGGATGRRRR